MLTTFFFFISQEMKNCIKSFRLTTDTMNRILKVLVIIYRFLEKACFRETILQITVEYFGAVSLQIFPVTFPTIFPGIECIQKNTPYKTNFCLPITCTRICSKMYTRIIYQRIFIYKTTYKELAKSLLHIFNWIGSIYRLGQICIITIFPSMAHKIRVILSFTLSNLPSQQNRLSFFKMLISRYSRS